MTKRLTRIDPPVNTRALRRVKHRLETQLTGIFNAVVSAHANLQGTGAERLALSRVTDEQLRAFRSEVGERLSEIERQLTGIVDFFKIPILPRWTTEQREAFERGESERDAATDLRLREAFRLL